jgi:ATP-dependent helicase/nuclease subunit A
MSSSVVTPVLDPDLRQRQAADPVASVWVAASAGSGKTKVLTDRVLRQLLAGTPPARILCLTFTKAAAAEMSIRINRTLGLWATVADAALEDRLFRLTGERPSAETARAARRLFARVIDCPGGMKLQTIHAFCQSLLRRFPLEAGLAPHFEVMDETTAAEVLAQAQRAVLTAARGAPDGALGQALARLTTDLHEDGLGALMAELAGERGRLRRILADHGGLTDTVAGVCGLLGVAPGSDETTVTVAASADRAVDGPGLRAACRALAAGSATDQDRGAAIADWLASDEAGRVAGFFDYQLQFLTREAEPRKTLITKKAAATLPAAAGALSREAGRLVAVMAARKAAAVAAATAALLTFAEALLAAYARLKAARALLDYDDLILAARDLLARPGVAPWVLFKLDGGLDHILIDEAQDTNPDQWHVVAQLAEEFFAGLGARSGPEAPVRTVFAVGDEKQSIFSFQRADPREFARLRRHFQQRVEEARLVWRQVRLDISFRSTAAVLRTVDRVFATPEACDGVALAAPGEDLPVIQHFSFRRGQGGRVELWPPVKPEPRPDPAPWQPPLGRESADQPPARLAAALADTVAGWLGDGAVLESRGRPVQPGDIMVLVRRRTGFVTELVRALKDRGVPVAGVDRMVLTEQLSVMDLVALAQVLLLREDDLTLAIVLKGPFIGLDEDRLFALAHHRPGSLWQALGASAAADPLSPEARARDWLDGLLAGADFVPPYEFFSGVLHRPCPADSESGFRAVLGRLGAEARDPLDEFLSVCLAFQRGHPPSLQGFLAWLASSQAEIKREQERGGGPGGGMVRIMTVHGAKGLQAPIVILPDTLGKPKQSARILWPDDGRRVPLYAPRRSQEEAVCQAARAAADQRRDQEYRRLLYVALTRAEDRLYVCGWQGKTEPPEGSWYQLIAAAVESDDQARRIPIPALGAGAEGWCLIGPQTVAAESDQAGAGPTVVPEPLPDWARMPAPPEAEPSRPLSPSRPDEVEPAVRSPLGRDDGSRFRRGLLLHRLFETLPGLEPGVRAAAAARFLARPGHGLDAEAQAALAAEALAVLEHPEFAPLFGPGSRAEVPLVGVVGDRVLSGQIDRLLVTDREVWIVDYKTNRPPPQTVAGVAPLYLRQMASYRAAISAIYPGHRVRCLLLWTDGPRLMELPEPPSP